LFEHAKKSLHGRETGFLQALHQIGYRGVVSQEILTQQPPTEPVEQLLERSKQGFDQVYRIAGLK
jgi:hypothetical protein